MMPFNPLVGEFRVHYAGFMDPGFGHAPAGGHGSRVVLEVRSHKVPFILEDGQIIGRLVYERMVESTRKCSTAATLAPTTKPRASSSPSISADPSRASASAVYGQLT